MTTDSNIPHQKKIVDVKVLHINQSGYGLFGSYTRENWRIKCNDMFCGDVDEFKKWAKNLEEHDDNEYVSFSYRVIFEDNTSYFQDAQCKRCSLDLIANEFNQRDVENLNLNTYKYPYPVLLSCAVFHCDISFDSAEFSEDVWLDNAVFKRQAIFNRAKIGGDAWFNNIRFDMNAMFANAKFANISIFRDAVFCDGVSFENATFANVCHFEGAKFITKVPNFLGVSIGNTHIEFSNSTSFPDVDTTEQSIKYLERLKRLADEHGQTEYALMFNSLELNAEYKQPNAGYLFRIFTSIYKYVSNYGQSFGRPLVAYLSLIFITYCLALLNAAHSSPQNCKGELWRVFSDWKDNGSPSCLSVELPEDKLRLNGYRAALEYTTYRAAGILDFSDNDKQTVAVSKRLFNADVEPTWMRFWGIFKAIASAALLFLAALGLRNKYRIK